MKCYIMSKHVQKDAFTLVELLVVISVIAVLMAILMPALQRVKEQAKKVICRSNQKQIGMAMSMYQEDNNGKFPSSYEGARPVKVYYGLDMLRDYLGLSKEEQLALATGGAIKVLTCPADKGAFGGWLTKNGVTRTPTYWQTEGRSYRFNSDACGRSSPTAASTGRSLWDKKLAVVRSPSQTVCFFDQSAHVYFNGWNPFMYAYWHNPNENGWANVMFADNHYDYIQFTRDDPKTGAPSDLYNYYFSPTWKFFYDAKR